jgi:anaphase-promoting complex subunit 5
MYCDWYVLVVLKNLPHIDPHANRLSARENQDTACLNFALSWLLYLRQAHNLPSASSLRSLAALAGDGGSEQDELAFLKAKAKESKHWSLVSSTLLEEAKLELRHVSISPPACKIAL